MSTVVVSCYESTPHSEHDLPRLREGEDRRCPGVAAPATLEADLEERLAVVAVAIRAELDTGMGGRTAVDDIEGVSTALAIAALRALDELARADANLASVGEWVAEAMDLYRAGKLLQAQKVILNGLGAERGLPPIE